MRLLARPHKFDVSFLIPKSITALASCTTSVYVNLSKNSFFMPPHLIFCAKASAKVQQISIPSKLLGENFQKIQKVFGIHDNSEFHLIYYNRDYSNNSSISASGFSKDSSTNEHGSYPSGRSKMAFSLYPNCSSL